MRQALQIKTDGTTNILDLDGPKGSYQTLNEGVGGWIECVSFPRFDMYINEEGKYNGCEYNHAATTLFVGHFGVQDRIMGDVVFVGPVDEEGESTALPEGEQKFLTTLARRSKRIIDALALLNGQD